MFARHAHSAKKAISLHKDSIFRLLILILSLLGWLCASFIASITMLENAYNSWNLEQKSHISIYLDADENRGKVVNLVEELSSVNNVKRAYLLSEYETADILKPYFSEGVSFPLPFVIDVTVTSQLDREYFNTKVNKYFANASIDDARDLLVKVSSIVRFSQWIILFISGVLLIIVAIIVSLTVSAGLRGKQISLKTMQHIGAQDKFLINLITTQVMQQSLIGWFISSILAGVTLYALLNYWSGLNLYMTNYVWAIIVIVPFLLSIVAVISAKLTAKRMIKSML